MQKTVLVNKEHKYRESLIKKQKLVKIKNIEDVDILLEEEAYHAYLKLRDFLLQKGIVIGIIAAYRSLDAQQELYAHFVEMYGEEKARKQVAPAGESEHHTALAIDLSIYIEEHFLVEQEVLMLQENIFSEIHSYLSQFGFILRYPKGKEAITGYSYVPWHIRYVGKTVASIIEKNHWTLEEYLSLFQGFLIVNKAKNMTSFDVVKEIRNLFGIEKVGHTGTLDPLAEGVLIIALGQATKVVQLVLAYDKEYETQVQLGVNTDTLDITGNIVETKEIPASLCVSPVLESFQKTYLQEVPLYSAIKVKGKKLYEYARKKQKVALPKKEVTIKEIKLLKQEKDTFTFRSLVSKGCYIRSLIRDICRQLNTCGVMSSLVRTKQGKITIDMANRLEDIKENHYTLYSIEEMLDYPIIIVPKEIEKKIRVGQKLKNQWNISDKVIFKNKTQLLGIYEIEQDDLKVWKNFCS